MASFKRPGVYVEEQLLTNNAIGGPSTSTAAFIAANSRGYTTPTKVVSWTDYTNKFGGFSGGFDLPHAVFQFFSNGGAEAYVVRAVGASGNAQAFVNLKDAQTAPGQDTLKVSAANVGTWGNSLYVTVTPGTGDRFSLEVKLGGTGTGNIVERWTDLTMDKLSSRYVETVVNQFGGSDGSNYIVVDDLENGAVSPTNRPIAVTNAQLTGGTASAPSSSEYAAAANKLDEVNSTLNVNLPGVTDTSTATLITTWARNRGDVFVVLDPPKNLTPAQVITHATSLGSNSYAALYYPNYYVQDPSATQPNTRRLQAPGGAVLGQFAATDAARGVHKAPAGLANRVANAVALEVNLTPADLDSLNVSNVNAIRNIPGAGICLFGARTLQADGSSDVYLPIRRTLIYIKRALQDGTRFAIFEPNDELLWASVSSAISQFLYTVWQNGGLKGTSPSQAYYVKCDADLNTPSVIASGEVRVEVGVSLQYPAEFVVIKIGQFEAGSSAAEA